MTTTILFCSLIVLCLVLAIASKLWPANRNGFQTTRFQADAERSMDFYRPMDRLLSESDFRFLATRPEIPQSTIRRIRRERRRVFRQYLGCLAEDFTSVTGEIRCVMVSSKHSRGDLASALVRARVVFTLAMLSVESRLVLHTCGIRDVSVSVSSLTETLAQMRLELRQLSPATSFSV